MKRKKIRLKYKKERVLLSDMLPYELPLIFSNRYFYRFLVKNGIHVNGDKIIWNENVSDGTLQILAFILGTNMSNMKVNGYVTCDDSSLKKNFQTIPFSYRILHKPTKSRELSLIHPRNQILMVDFYDRYKSLMLYYCSLDKYSLRYPNKVACYFYYRDKLHKTLIGRKTDSLELFFNEYENLRTFFSYKRYNNIYKFYEDYRYQRAEKKFAHLLKFDIQGCFDSIYTHSIAWATGGGKDIYKESFRSEDNTFGSKWDRQMQLMNYNETNGIVIGPEFSRIFAEVIFQHVDSSVAHSLKKEKYDFERDYVCYRYVDDYFFFYNDEACRKKAIELFDEKLKEFKLAISAEKTHEFSRPFITDITRAKIRIDQLIDNELQYHSVQNLTEENIEDEADTVDDNIESTLNLSLLETAIDDKDWLHFNSRKFNQTFKSILVECNVEAKDVINYTLSRLGNKLSSDIKKFDKNFKVLSRTMSNVDYTEYHSKIQKAKQKKEDMIVAFMEELLDVTFFLYASNKRVNTTLKVINILNLIIIHLDNDYEIKGENVVKYSDNARDIVFKKIQDELSLVLKTTSVEPNTQLETLFFLIINKQLRSKYHFGNIELTKYLQRFAEDDSLNALSIIILLYYYGNESRYSSLKLKLVEKIKKKYKSESLDFKRKSAEFCILTLDLITCPYLTYQDKKEIVDLIGINEPELKLMQNHLRTQKYMFTKWTKIDITKELSAKISQEVYA
jgi:hypothetical protein